MRTWRKIGTLLAAAGLLAGCRRDMMDGARYKPLEPSGFFEDGAASRPLPEHTLARGELRADEHYFTGRVKGQLVTAFPEPVTRATIERGRQRFDIYCAVCHNATGDGKGMVVQRGFVPPPNLHEQRLKDAPPGHIFQVVSNGWGAMFSYNDRIPVDDRWRIAAYVKVLQFSQSAPVASLPAELQAAVADAEKHTYGPGVAGPEGTEGREAAPAKGAGHE